MSILGAFVSLALRGTDRRLRKAVKDPAASQRRVFGDLIERAADTWFGHEHGFAKIRTHADFVNAVPIRDYVTQIEMFERIVSGERDVCWPGRVKYFAQTSGTTAGDKNIPVTSEMMRSDRHAAMGIFAFYDRREGASAGRLFDGKMLFLGGSTDLTETESGALIGDLSGIATESIHWPLTRVYEPGEEIALIDDWEKKVEAVAQRDAELDVRFVTGMPSWVKVLFDRLCELKQVDPNGGMSEIWPNFELFVHGGVDFGPYREGFRRYFRKDHRLEFLEVYPASEGFIAIQAERGDPGMEMLVENGLFFEFVPLSEWGEPNAARLTIDQVEEDVPYSLVLSTCAGLWAYDLGDVVRFVSLSPPRIVFAGRNKHFINGFGENVIGEQVSEAMQAAQDKTGAEVEAFTAAPLYPDEQRGKGAHQYVVEFRRPPDGGEDRFAAAVDEKLQELNHDYSVKRSGDLGMSRVEVMSVPEGTFYEWMKRKGKLGGQHKVPVCANDRDYVDEVLEVGREMG